jgi:hypothetical protein
MALVRKLPGLSFVAISCALVPGLIGAEAEVDWRAWRSAPVLEWTGNVHVAAVPRVGEMFSDPVATADGYWAWARQVFTADELADPFVSGPDAEYLDDGVSNLTKYAYGYAPGDDCPEALGDAAQLGEHWFFHFDWPTDLSDVEFRVEVSTDLVNWTSEGVTMEPIAAVDGAESWQAQFQASAVEAVYFRLVTVLR